MAADIKTKLVIDNKQANASIKQTEKLLAGLQGELGKIAEQFATADKPVLTEQDIRNAIRAQTNTISGAGANAPGTYSAVSNNVDNLLRNHCCPAKG